MQALVLIAAALLCLCIVLPVVAFVRTNKIRNIEMRLAGVEATLLRLMRQSPAVEPPPAVEIPPAAAAYPDMTMRYLDVALTNLQREFHLAHSQPRHLAPQPRAHIVSPRSGLGGVIDSLLATRHLLEMFRRTDRKS